jgi:hypothetical protein
MHFSGAYNPGRIKGENRGIISFPTAQATIPFFRNEKERYGNITGRAGKPAV